MTHWPWRRHGWRVKMPLNKSQKKAAVTVSPPDVLQQKIIDHLEAALAAFLEVAAGLPATTR